MSKSKGFLFEMTSVAVATPAALGLVGQFDKRVSFNVLLERAVRNYDIVLSAAFSWLHSISAISIQDVQMLGFTLFLVVQVITSQIFQSRDRSSVVWGLLSITSIVIFMAAFEVDDNFSIGNELLDPFIETAAFLVVGISLWMISKFDLAGLANEIQIRPDTLKWFGWVFVALSGAKLMLFLFSNDHEKRYGQPYPDFSVEGVASSLIFTLVCFALIVTCWHKKLKGPAYVLLWAAGILCINWLSEKAIPTIERWLTSIGA